MITEADKVDAKLRRGITHRHNPAFAVAYDDRRRFPVPHILTAIRRYDPNLFVRFNRAAGMWELWRWYGLVVPRRPWAVSPEELTQRAGFVFKLCDPNTGEPIPPDWRLYRRLVLADFWARGQYTGEQAANAMDSESATFERRKAAANAQFTSDWASDNKSQIKSLIGAQTIYSIPR